MHGISPVVGIPTGLARLVGRIYNGYTMHLAQKNSETLKFSDIFFQHTILLVSSAMEQIIDYHLIFCFFDGLMILT